ncbi:MAG: ferric reductase-like transmembrane domain-containing protein [Desulfobacterales bacterium]|nr:MAG: ferric reductase-like transmembrane domain-containing protein [Desulfobacterales bacterium]
MKAKGMNLSLVFTLRKRFALGGTCIFLVLILLVTTWTIPFLFESPSILYKFGIHKTYLRSGKIFGLTAAVLVFFQVLLASRIKLLDRIFSLNRIYFFHRVNGIAIAILVLLHPILILAAENFAIFPFEVRYWPEFLGVGLMVIMAVLVATANWRLLFGFAYDKWLRLHRLGVVPAIALILIHILFVSETFKSGLPRVFVCVITGVNLLLILRLWYYRFFPGKTGKSSFVISAVERVGRDAYAVDVKPHDGQLFSYIPGQFAFITPISANVPKEEHPFTIASTPSRHDALQFIIRTHGDWTGKIHRLQVGDSVFIDGPYGLFSHVVSLGNDPIIMIAGGIGITPMLSMLRYMANMDDQRKILLIWSNKTKEYIVFPEEFRNLKYLLKNFKIINIITRGHEDGDEQGRLDQAKLERLLKGFSRTSKVFICGPFEMMKEVSRVVKKIGFSSTRVYKEAFKL